MRQEQHILVEEAFSVVLIGRTAQTKREMCSTSFPSAFKLR